MPHDSKLTTLTAVDPAHAGRVVHGGAGTVDVNDQDSGRISVDLLGGLRVRAGGATMGPRDLGGTKPRHVLLALLLHRGSPVPKERLISLLWGGSPPSRARTTLEGYVCILRKRLQPGQAVRGSLITTVAGCYAIDLGRVDLDVLRYERLAAEGLHPSTCAADALPMLEQAMDLAESPLLPEEVNSEWLDDVRRTHGQQIRKDLVAAAGKVAGLPFGSSERWARMALEGDPLDESAWQALLASLEASGRHADGLQAYDGCRRLFAAELGCAPGPGLQALYVRLLRGANENDEELSLLLDAVVRLHMASRPSSEPPATSPETEVTQAPRQNASVVQAFHALNLLLGKVGGQGSQLTA
jgi:DNA-binding SARP family transcriptional activator